MSNEQQEIQSLQSKVAFLTQEVELYKQKNVLMQGRYEADMRASLEREHQLSLQLHAAKIDLIAAQQQAEFVSQKVKMITAHLEERENTVWSFVFNKSPDNVNGGDEGGARPAIPAAQHHDTTASVPSPPTTSGGSGSDPFAATDEEIAALRSPEFNMWRYQADRLRRFIGVMFIDLGLVARFDINEKNLDLFLQSVQNNYPDNPFHNFSHCFAVAHMTFCISTLIMSQPHATPFTHLDVLILMISAVCHDLQHPGLNNGFQVAAQTELALRYNDVSPLENHHCATAFRILSDTKLLAHLPAAEYKNIRQTIIACILATDMARHFEVVSQFESKVEELAAMDDDTIGVDDRRLVLEVLIKCADVSNEIRPWLISKPWADRLLEEFAHQADTEAERGLPQTQWMRRENMNQAQMQLNFIDHVLTPLFTVAAKGFPPLSEFLTRLKTSRALWGNMYMTSSSQ